MAMMTISTSASTEPRSSGIAGQHGWNLLGLAMASLIPSLFWTILIELVSLSLGVHISPFGLAIFGFGIAVFLAAVCAPLVLRSSATEVKS
jgi:hypothetical protein